jgi:hypothetical protein
LGVLVFDTCKEVWGNYDAFCESLHLGLSKEEEERTDLSPFLHRSYCLDEERSSCIVPTMKNETGLQQTKQMVKTG